MQIKASREPQFEKVPSHSLDQIKRQCTMIGLSAPPNLQDSKQQQKIIQYLQVNYLKNNMYKVSPQLHSKVPLQKEEENLRDYLIEVQNDHEKHEEFRNELKFNYFFKNNNIKGAKSTSQSKRASNSLNLKKQKHQVSIQIFDPIEYLHQKESQKKKQLSRKIKKLQNLNMFADNIESVKYISEAPQIKILEPISTLGSKSLMTFTNRKDSKLSKTNQEIRNSISKFMEKSKQYENQSQTQPKKMKHYKSRNDLKKSNDKKIALQRKKIMTMIEHKSVPLTVKPTHEPTTLNQIPAKQKYAIDFTLYMRTKTKSQLDKYMHQKLIKKPQKDLEKFQEFMLKEVKFENEENRHKMERFFIKMREQFRRIQKYSETGSKFDWRSRSVRLEDIKKANQALGLVSEVKEKPENVPKEKMMSENSKKSKSGKQKFLRVNSVQKSKGKSGRIKFQINQLSQTIPYNEQDVENEQNNLRKDKKLEV